MKDASWPYPVFSNVWKKSNEVPFQNQQQSNFLALADAKTQTAFR